MPQGDEPTTPLHPVTPAPQAWPTAPPVAPPTAPVPGPPTHVPPTYAPPGFAPPSYAPPTSANPSGGWQPPPPPGWQPPQPVARAPRPGGSGPRRGLAVLAMVVLIGFLVGALAGGALVRLGGSASPSAEPSAAPPVTAPSSPTLPGGQTDPFSGLDPTDPFGGGQGGNQNGAAPSSPQSPSTSGGGLSTEDMNAVADKVTPGVVHINTVTAEGQGAGTGMVLEASGVVLTNNHVVRGATQIVATDADTGRRYAAKVLGTDATDDVALLQLQSASGLGTVDTGDSGSLDPGEPVVAVGNAGGRGGDPTVVTGSVIATDQAIDVADESGRGTTHLSGLIQIDAPIEPGDSGGPLADADGKVVGINTAASADMRTGTTTGEGYAVPIEKALAVVEQIQSGKGSDTVHIGVRGVLGVSVSTGNSGGASVLDVAQGSGAEDAGITAGSVVTAVDGTQVDSADTLTSAMANRKPGDKVTIVWVDQSGSRHSAQVTLTEGPPD